LSILLKISQVTNTFRAKKVSVKEKEFSGNFIVIEGADGAGTTTQSKRLAEELEAELTFEPTDKTVGRKVDEMISSDDHSPETIALGFAADRMVHLEERVIPWLKKGKTVVSDRYAHSSLVYQPVMGVDKEWVESLNQEALKPDLTVILDISAEVGMSRVEERGHDGNIFEEMSFQQKVVKRYREMEDREDVVVIDASGSKDEVFEQLKAAVDEKLDF
jgi:dTMP kinase